MSVSKIKKKLNSERAKSVRLESAGRILTNNIPDLDPHDPKNRELLSWAQRIKYGSAVDPNPPTAEVKIAGTTHILSRMSGDRLAQWTRIQIEAAEATARVSMMASRGFPGGEIRAVAEQLVGSAIVLTHMATGLPVKEVASWHGRKRRPIIDAQADLNGDVHALRLVDVPGRIKRVHKELEKLIQLRSKGKHQSNPNLDLPEAKLTDEED